MLPTLFNCHSKPANRSIQLILDLYISKDMYSSRLKCLSSLSCRREKNGRSLLIFQFRKFLALHSVSCSSCFATSVTYYLLKYLKQLLANSLTKAHFPKHSHLSASSSSSYDTCVCIVIFASGINYRIVDVLKRAFFILDCMQVLGTKDGWVSSYCCILTQSLRLVFNNIYAQIHFLNLLLI